MHQFSVESGQAIAKGVRSVITHIDNGLIDNGRLLADFIQAMQEADVAPAKSQKTIKALITAMEHLTASRAEMVGAHRRMMIFKGDSNLDVLDFGCWFGRKSEGKPTLVTVAA